MTATAPIDERVAAAPPPRAKRGRPKNPEPAENVESALGPYWKDGREGGADFFDWLTQFSTDDWQLLTAYVFRTAPTIDRRNSGRHLNIGKYGCKFDRETVLNDHGSGSYRIDLTLRDAATGKSQRIGQHYFTLLDLKHPPRVPPGDWVNDPENNVWKWAGPMLQAEAEAAAAGAPPAAGASGDQTTFFNAVLAGVEKLTGGKGDSAATTTAAIVNAMNDLQKQVLMMSDPARQIQMIQTIMALVAPPQKNGEDRFEKFMMAQFAAMQHELALLRNQPKPDFLTLLKDGIPIVKEVLSGLGLGRAARAAADTTSEWAGVVETVVKELSANAPLITAAFTKNPQAAAAAGFQLAGATTTPAAEAPAETPGGAAPVPPTNDAAKAQAEAVSRLKPMLQKWGVVLLSVAPFLIDQFKNSMTGYDFRDWFILRQTLAQYNSLRVDIKVEDMFHLLRSHPQVSAQLQPDDKLQAFLMEFYTEQGMEPEGAKLDDKATEEK